MENLLWQRREIKRFEQELERQKREEEESEILLDEEVKERAVKDFELVQMGLGVSTPENVGHVVGRENGRVIIEETKEGKKRKFELDEDELIRIAREDRERAKKALNEEKVFSFRELLMQITASKRGITNFWIPSLTPSTGKSELSNGERKLSPICPASDPENAHPLSLKALVPINFSEDPQDKTKDGQPLRICPSCKKALTNNMKSYRACLDELANYSRPCLWTRHLCTMY
jgi:nitric oxide synthase-interacting protein